RDLQQQIDALRAEKNKLGREDQEKGKELKEKLKGLEESFKTAQQQRTSLYNKLPNIPFDDVPIGKSDAENVVLRTEGKLPTFDFTPKEHWQIGEELDIIDLERAAKVAGSRFYFLKNEAAVLETALISYVFTKLAKKGFIPVIPPVMIKPEMAE